MFLSVSLKAEGVSKAPKTPQNEREIGGRNTHYNHLPHPSHHGITHAPSSHVCVRGPRSLTLTALDRRPRTPSNRNTYQTQWPRSKQQPSERGESFLNLASPLPHARLDPDVGRLWQGQVGTSFLTERSGRCCCLVNIGIVINHSTNLSLERKLSSRDYQRLRHVCSLPPHHCHHQIDVIIVQSADC